MALFFCTATVLLILKITASEAGDTEIWPIPTECPSEDPKNYTVHLQHENDCTKFYKCDHGEKVLFDCPDSLHFNPVLQVCDWPENANCQAGTPSSTKPKPTSKPPKPTCRPTKPTPTSKPTTTKPKPTSKPTKPKPTTTKPKPTCRPPKPKPTSKPTTKRPKPTSKPTKPKPTTTKPKPTCRPPKPKPTSKPTTKRPTPTSKPTKPKPTTTKPKPTCKPTKPSKPARECPFPDPLTHTVHLPHETDCTKFYKCDNGVKVEFTCPDGLHFNEKLEVCDWPQNAGCKNQP